MIHRAVGKLSLLISAEHSDPQMKAGIYQYQTSTGNGEKSKIPYHPGALESSKLVFLFITVMSNI